MTLQIVNIQFTMMSFSTAFGVAIIAACAICSNMVCVNAVQIRSDAGPIDYEQMPSMQALVERMEQIMPTYPIMPTQPRQHGRRHEAGNVNEFHECTVNRKIFS